MRGTKLDRAIAAFLALPEDTDAWLADPRLEATLAAASADLAPGGRATNEADGYAASVIATHLEARRRLARLQAEAIEA